MSLTSAVVALRPTLERLAGFAALGRNWDSYGGLPSAPRAISTATELLVLLADHLPELEPTRIVPYAVVPVADGGVQLEWRGRRSEVEVEVGPGGAIDWLLIDRDAEQDRYSEQHDVEIQNARDLVADVLLA
jgi:hypothetical protein